MQRSRPSRGMGRARRWLAENKGVILASAAVTLVAVSVCATLVAFRETAAERRHVEAAAAFVRDGARDGEDEARRDWEALWDANESICAWVTVGSAGIDLPVLSGDDGYFYLDHDVNGDWSQSGSVVLDEYCDTPDMMHCMAYGHHLYSGGMFSPLQMAYQQEVLDSLGEMVWDTPESNALVLRPLCAASVDKSYRLVRQFTFVDAAAMREWLAELCADADARVADADDLCARATRAVTCVTCSSDWAGQPERTIVTFVATQEASGKTEG